jgi:hypothetical protein
MVALSVSCWFCEVRVQMGTRKVHTISSRTSPAEKDSPSLFFHEEMPPSVMVGDMAGISRLVMAYRTLVWCRAGKNSYL